MHRFAALYDSIDATTSTHAKVAAMVRYFRNVEPADAAWAVSILAGGRIKRLIGAAVLRRWVAEESGLSQWLVDECRATAGDFAETASILCGQGPVEGTGRASTRSPFRAIEALAAARPSSVQGMLFAAHGEPALGLDDGPVHVVRPGDTLATVMATLQRLRSAPEGRQRLVVTGAWRSLPRLESFVFTKLITGALRVGVSRTLVERALAEIAGVSGAVVAHRLAGDWTPSVGGYAALIAGEDASLGAADLALQPFPFFLASPLEDDASTLGPIDQWLLEWKWDGIRAQLLRRVDGVALWSRGDELLTDRFPELREAARVLPPGLVLDGEVVAWRDGRPLPFTVLQRRIGRTNVSRRALAEAPTAFMAFDLLAIGGADVRERPLRERRARLDGLLADIHPRLVVSPRVEAADWVVAAALRAESRGRGVEGLVLKSLDSPYRAGRRRGEWWKWKVDPFTIDAVLVHAQPGSGRRANLLTDYTFALWRDGELVPFAKAYSGLSDEEIRELDAWIRTHTLDRFGPVRSVEPVHVFELGFEAVQRSARHRSGVAVRFPRMLRWRRDKPAAEADALEALLRRAAEAHP